MGFADMHNMRHIILPKHYKNRKGEGYKMTCTSDKCDWTGYELRDGLCPSCGLLVTEVVEFWQRRSAHTGELRVRPVASEYFVARANIKKQGMFGGYKIPCTVWMTLANGELKLFDEEGNLDESVTVNINQWKE